MRMLRLTILISLTLAGAKSFADFSVTAAPENFVYEFHPADIFPWIRGDRSGPVPDEQGAVAQGLGKFISQANNQLKFAVYGVDKQSWFLEELGKFKARGIQMQFVVDQDKGSAGEWIPDNFTYPATHKIPSIIGKQNITADLGSNSEVRTSSIMHNKFVLVDDRGVWTGSANISGTCMGSSYNANVSLWVDSPSLNRVFKREFEQMFSQKQFSSEKETPSSPVKIVYRDGTEAIPLFSPQDDAIQNGIIPFLKASKSKLDIAMFYLTEESIANEIVAAHRRGVKVRVIMDAIGAANMASKHVNLRDAGIEVRVENWGGKMHMKSASSDGKHLIIGSMNWTFAGNTRNDENTLIISKAPSLAQEYDEFFDKMWSTLRPQMRRPFIDPRAEGKGSVNSCQDGSDNDYDKLVDQDDPDCR
jgi:phosphatidylserine/phosphatidylglycerophosphate/cardiolipin synthase-like enzyme